jgi:ATP-dependent exoDNAse (exonuclease V) alpha subunit
LILTDERFGDVKGRILNNDVLVIDEISMVSNRTLRQVEFISEKIKDLELHVYMGRLVNVI